jgi:hypothetical protein
MDPTIIPNGNPCWSREVAIGDYGGDLSKENSTEENPEPYAAQWYRELHEMRGSAYTTKPGTMVDAENVALARFFASVWSRNAEKLRANATPARADERLPYWATVLGVPHTPSDPRWLIRQRCAAHYAAAQAPTEDAVVTALQALLGEAYVGIYYPSNGVGTNTTFNDSFDDSFTVADYPATPPGTYWPAETAGPSSYDLGGGAWISSRSHLAVKVVQPSAMSDADFLQMVDVQMFQLLDRMLPAHATFGWYTGDGFLVDISRVGFDGVTD